MKKMLKLIASCLFVMAFVASGHPVAAQGQSRESRIISARAGGVNFVSGEVTFRKATETRGQALTIKDNLSTGDVVRTGGSGRAEILLNPGSYIRLAENSEFEFSDASLDNMRLKMVKGSAVIEATGYSNVETLIVVETPHTQASIIRSGVYRINILAPDTTEVAVRKGRAVIGNNAAAPIKGDKKARVVGSTVEVVKYDKKREKDAFDEWSKERAETLADANRKLSNRNVNTLLASYNMNSLWSASYQPNGLWLFDNRYGCYTFLPFYARWSSPYGRSYNNMLNYYGYGYNGYSNNCQGCSGSNNGGRLVMTNNQSGVSNGGSTAASPASSPGGGQQSSPITSGTMSGPSIDSPRSMPVDRDVMRERSTEIRERKMERPERVRDQ